MDTDNLNGFSSVQYLYFDHDYTKFLFENNEPGLKDWMIAAKD